MNEKQIRNRIQCNAFFKKANEENKVRVCPFCGKENPQLCNSHSVPEFILRNISGNEGIVDNIFNVLDDCLQKEKLGVGQAGCFKMICRECDSQAFRNYENEDLLLEFKDESSILSEIALKNILRNMYGMLDEMSVFGALYEKYRDENFIQNAYICYDDADKYFQEMDEIINNICNSDTDDFCVLYKNYLSYVTPVAAQGCFELKFDCFGRVINIGHGMEHDFLRLLHVAVFPLNNKTLVLAFIRKKCIREYKDFIEQFIGMSEEEKIDFINYIVFKCTDNFYLSKNIDKRVYTEEFKKICDPTSENNKIMFCKGVESIAYEIQSCPNFLRMKN